MSGGFFDSGLLTNHDHTNTPGDGGQLSNLSVLGTLSSTGLITAGGGVDSTNDKGLNLSPGTVATDAANYGQIKLDLLGTQFAAASAAIQFTGLAGGNYAEFFVMIGNLNATGAGVFLQMQLSTGSGFIATNYSDAQFRVIQSAASGGGGQNAGTAWQIGIYTEALGTGSHYYGRITIPVPRSNAANKAMFYQASAISSNGASIVSFTGGGQGAFNSAPVDGIKFFMSSGTIASGDFYLYGIRGV
jgi:hypothetical protein